MFCTDIMGNLNAEAIVAVNGMRGEYYTISTSIREGIELDLSEHYSCFEEAVDVLMDLGFAVVETREDGYGWPKALMAHVETLREIERLRAEAQAKYTETGYVRFGSVPESGHSVNHATGAREAGVSCFRAVFDKDGSYQLLVGPKLYVSLMTVKDREVYRLWGEEVGTGSDGEPLLKVEKERKIGSR